MNARALTLSFVSIASLIAAACGNHAANASGNATPLRKITGSATRLNGPAGLTVRSALIFVANGGGNAITVYHELGNGNIQPLRAISGPSTGLNHPLSAGIR